MKESAEDKKAEYHSSETELAVQKPDKASMVESTSQATSWAKMAGTLADSQKTLNLKPENQPSGAGPRLKPVGRIPPVEKRGEVLANQLRLVFLMNLPSNITLTDISDGIQEGPVVSITFNNDADTGSRFAGIIFQNAGDAVAFHNVLCSEKLAKAPQRFKFIVDSAISEEPVPVGNLISR